MLARARWVPLLCASLATALLASGCFRGPRLGAVTGNVTLDGEPLANAQVEFQPTRGAPSYGTTNSLGQYELKYTKDKPGARVGSHVVRITTQTTAVDPETGEEYQIPQQVPEKYNYRSDLLRQVKAEPNVFDFPLESEAEEKEPEKLPGEEPTEAEGPGEKKPEAEQPGAEAPPAQATEPGVSRTEAAAPQWAEVSGTVVLNGQPLAGATVEFQPAQGPSSRCNTDAQGHYQVTRTGDNQGALVGKHVVRISSGTPVDAETERINRGKLVPSIYNVESELTVEVRAGKNTFDFNLEG